MEENKRLVCGEELLEEKKRRMEIYDYIEDPDFSKISSYENLGWELLKKYKTKAKFRKSKAVTIDEQFENEVWHLFYQMGFKFMNKSRNFKLTYSEQGKELTQQIDIFAADDESIIIVECKASNTLNKKTTFKTDIEAIGGKMQGIFASARKLLPNKKLKVKYVFATKNYVLSEQDKDRMKELNIFYFDEDVIKYYFELYEHIGSASRYQFLGNLFAGQKIPEMDCAIPAIEGNMGGHTYYSFSIEPEKLLKMGFVLHHDNAYKEEMPAYQRIIKKARLKTIKDFINNGGFFPNSVIISISSKSKLQFDKSSLQVDNSISKIGILHLPQEYKSVYIIDGQHRLYGYSDSQWSQKNTIPVVAFVNLDKFDQIKLFMEINENQKAVPKNLRTTLEADLLWDSEDKNEQRKALGSFIAQKLGEDKNSALYGRIVTGENVSNPYCSVTLDYISKTLKQSNFYNKYNKRDLISNGTFDKDNNDDTFKKLYPFLIKSFSYFEEHLPDIWKLDKSSDLSIISNTYIYALIKIFSDIVDFLHNKNIINISTDIDTIIDEAIPYYDVVLNYIEDLPPSERANFRNLYGRVGDVKLWRSMQQAINIKFPEFNPDGMIEYWKDNSMKYNEEAFRIIRDIELYVKELVITSLKKKYNQSWFRSGCPRSVYDSAQKLASDKNYEKEQNAPDELPEDQLHLIDYRDIAIYGSNWSDLFEKHLGNPNISGDKKKKTEWLQKLNTIRNQNFHTYSITEEEYNYISSIKNWLIK